jgi:hypothetical protein
LALNFKSSQSTGVTGQIPAMFGLTEKLTMQFEWSTGHDSFPDFLIKLRPPALCQISETPFAELF